MNVVQKLVIDKELTTNLQVIVRDETGLYNPSNTTGYGGSEGDLFSKFERYIFDLTNLHTGVNYRQIQSDFINDTDMVNPSLVKIVNKENIIIDADTFELLKFEDSIYRLTMNLEFNTVYQGKGFAGTETVINVGGAQTIFDNYQSIIIGNKIYDIEGIVDKNLILNRLIEEDFTSFRVIIKTHIDFILSNELDDCIDLSIANLSKSCDPKDKINTINILSEIQLYQWALKRSIDENDIDQAYEYFKMAKNLCGTNCNYHG